MRPQSIAKAHMLEERDLGASVVDDEDEKLKPPPNDPYADGFGPYVKKSLHALLLTTHLNWLLLCTPMAFWSKWTGGSDVAVFTQSAPIGHGLHVHDSFTS